MKCAFLALLRLAATTQGLVVSSPTPRFIPTTHSACDIRVVPAHMLDEEPVVQAESASPVASASKASNEPMNLVDYVRFLGTILGFVGFFYVFAAIIPAGAALTPMEIAAKVDADWTTAHGTAAISQLYTPDAVVIKGSADRFEPAVSFAAEESTTTAKPSVTLTPVSAERRGDTIHHIFKTCTVGEPSCGNGYFRLEKRGEAGWRIATDVWTLTPRIEAQ